MFLKVKAFGRLGRVGNNRLDQAKKATRMVKTPKLKGFILS
jgi:hypothetical protein